MERWLPRLRAPWLVSSRVCMLVIAVLVSACGLRSPVLGVTIGAVTVRNVWMRTPIPGVDTDAIYMVLTNTSDSDDALIGVQSDVATEVMIHATTNTNGVMAMRPVTSIVIPAHGSVSLEAGVYHVMLVGRTRTVQRGDHVAVQLQFQHAGSGTVQAEVRDRPPDDATHSYVRMARLRHSLVIAVACIGLL